ncbi:PREDICTED: meiosis inhibitor protein 1-like [Priapulus caudatus]|uniref:Meiosis inhibitor protein 1-like n=1 Tax=Priapulus caudatus TaxID=37621 RepID=A0ABM1EKD9_PRICU|nr:PREDICTED: meiosis inhibitor protein 1-like [Priapulus caudatus]
MYTESLLDADITEFLFEALATTNELLLESIFCCLMVFTDTQTFFTKCHVIYGIESVLRAVDLSFQQRKPSTIVRGMDLLGLILQKQPERMPLLSSDKTFTECLRIINTGISHSYHQVALSSGVAYCHLLRRQHIPSPVPYNALLNTLEQLVMRLHTLPTMRCIPSDNRKGQHNQSGLFRQAQSTQQMIECTLNCLRAVARLMLSCMDDPTANPETFAAPTSVSVSDMPVSSSIQFDVNIPGAMQASVSTHLLQLCDEHCMPAVIQNKQYLASSEIYRSLLDTLNIMFRIQPKMMKLFSEKLASVGFYRMALELKDQWPKNASLQDAVDQLVSVCCSTLMTAHHDGIQNSPTPVNFTDLKLGVQQLSGPLGKFILVLTQCSTVDRKLQAAQVACIALCHLFLEHDHSRMAACAPSLFRVLVTFLSLHADLSWIPPTSLQQLLSLCATAETALSPQQREELPAADRRLSRQNLLRALESVPDMHAIYGQNDVLLHWTFSDRVLAQTIGQRMLSDWLSQKSNHGGKHIELAVKMLLNNELFCNSFLGFLQSGTADTVLSLLDVLKVFIRQEDMLAAPDRDELFDAVRARLPDLLQITDSSASISGASNISYSFVDEGEICCKAITEH